MNNSSLEITENEYCIKLDKGAFDLTLIRQLIKRIQNEQLFVNRSRRLYEEEDIISRRRDPIDGGNYDSLSDK